MVRTNKYVFIKRFVSNDEIDNKIYEALDWLKLKSSYLNNKYIFIKPNLTWPYHMSGVTFSPRFLEALISVLKAYTDKIIIGESDGGYHSFKAEEAFKGHGIYNIAKKYDVKIVNLSKLSSEIVITQVNSKKVEVELPPLLLHDIDIFITMPVPKIHAMTGVSLAFKNQWGCIPSTMRFLQHYEFNEKIVAINKLLNPIAIYDGTYFLDKNGPMAGEPVQMDLIIASNDIGAGDFTCCKLMGIDVLKIKHLNLAMKEQMLPSSLGEIYFNEDIQKYIGKKFLLKRNFLNWIALLAFNNRWGTKIFYKSRVGSLLHKILYTIRKNSKIAQLLYGNFKPSSD